MVRYRASWVLGEFAKCETDRHERDYLAYQMETRAKYLRDSDPIEVKPMEQAHWARWHLA
jgi:hypothetical protein